MTTKRDASNPFVSSEMTMGEIVDKFPEAIETIQAYGLHCVGCGISQFETLEQGAAAHGMAPGQTKEMLEEINSAIEKAGATGGKTINLTNRAAEKMREVLAKEKEGTGIRIEVAGASFALTLSEKKEGDKQIEDKGVKICYPASQEKGVKGAKVDFVHTAAGSGFKIAKTKA